MDWKNYEKEIFGIFKEEYPNAEISHNVLKRGRYSKVNRQCDIIIEDYIAGNRMTIVVDGKFFNKKIDVKEVESFIGLLEDVGAHKGLLISQKGFTKAAVNRAYYGPSEIEIDILNFDGLKSYQCHSAIPYAGNNGILLPAPFGWIVHAETGPNWLATLYQRGLTLDRALKCWEIMYVQFWDRKKNNESLDDLLKLQEDTLKQVDPEAIIEYQSTVKRNDARTRLRVARLRTYPTAEYTGFVEFENFIFFCVMFTPEELHRKNVRKLENIMNKVIPIQITHRAAKEIQRVQ